MRTSEVLNTAADLIREHGWARGNAGMLVDGPYCLEGAIEAARGGFISPNTQHIVDSDAPIGADTYDYSSCHAVQAVGAYLAERMQERPYDFNDRLGRTPDEVIAVLRAAAVIEAAREEAADTAAVLDVLSVWAEL